jgi:hypothetical protein
MIQKGQLTGAAKENVLVQNYAIRQMFGLAP